MLPEMTVIINSGSGNSLTKKMFVGGTVRAVTIACMKYLPLCLFCCKNEWTAWHAGFLPLGDQLVCQTVFAASFDCKDVRKTSCVGVACILAVCII